MRVTNFHNKFPDSDDIQLEYNHEVREWDFLIGKVVRGQNMFRLGKVVSIDYHVDGYGHDNAMAILDNGRRINVRVFRV